MSRKATAKAKPAELASSLAFASRVGDLEEVRRLLAADADPNIRDEVGETALFEAAASGNVGVVATLLLAGADPDVQSLMGTAAVESASNSTTRALLQLCGGEQISVGDRRAILAAMPDEQLSEQTRLFIQSLSGEDPDPEEEDDGDGDGDDDSVAPLDERGDTTVDPEDDDTWDVPILPVSTAMLMARKKEEPPKPVVEIEMVVTHAIQDGQIKLKLMSNVTFAEVKQAILQRLERAGLEARNLYLVRKERDAYQAYRDKEPIGDVRQVRMVGAALPPMEDGDL